MGIFDGDEDNNQSMSSVPKSDDEPNICAYPDASPNNNQSSDLFYHDPSTDNMTLADGSNSKGQPSGSGGTQFYSFYDYSPMSSSNAGSFANYYSGMSGSGGANASFDPGICDITDIPISPNIVLQGSGMEVSGDRPVIDLLLVGPDGSQSGETMTLKKDEKGRLHWNAQNATNVLINGVAAPLNGSMDVPFNGQYSGSDMPYEIVAWKNDQENSTIRLLSIIMSDKVAVGLSKDVNFKLKKPIGNGTNFKYVKITGEIEFKVTGKFTSNKSDNYNVNVNNNDASMKATFAKLSTEIDFVSLECSLKGAFKIPKDATPKTENGKSVWAEIGASAEAKAVFKLGKTCEVTIGGELKLVNVTLARSTSGYEWEWKCGEVEISLEDSDKFTYKNEDGVFDLSFQFSGKVKGEPNWPAIIREVCSDYGEPLGIDALTAGLGIAAAVVTSPAMIASGVLTMIYFGYSDIKASQDLLELRDKIPNLAKAIANGVRDGLYGTSTNYSACTVTNIDNAYMAGLFAGTKKRDDLIAHNEPFTEKSEEDKAKIIESVQGQCVFKMHSTFYAEKAGAIKNSFSNDITKLKDQMAAWNNIIGGANPVNRGGQYLELWKQYRPDAPSENYYNGSW
jgi:hypothetical protein